MKLFIGALFVVLAVAAQAEEKMIKFPSPVAFNNFIQPIALAEGTNSFVGENVVLSGWGLFGSTQEASAFLRFVNLQVITNLACSLRFPLIIQDSTLCANGVGNAGGCSGDSGKFKNNQNVSKCFLQCSICFKGGPLTAQSNGQFLLVGVASFVYEEGCEKGFPTGFSRVSSFIPWIQSHM